MGNCIKRAGQIYGDHDGSIHRLVFVEAMLDVRNYLMECCGGRALFSKAVLVVLKGGCSEDLGEEKALQDLD